MEQEFLQILWSDSQLFINKLNLIDFWNYSKVGSELKSN